VFSLALVGCWPYRVVSPSCSEKDSAPNLLAATASLRPGYPVRGKVIDLATGDGLVGATRIVLDGCGFVQVRERPPWWQSWFPPAT